MIISSPSSGLEGNQLSWGYVAVGAATLISGYMSKESSKDAAEAAGKGYDAATAEQARQYDQTRQDMQPWLEAGGDALRLQRRFLAGDQTAFTESPDYQWVFDQGRAGVEGSAAARGNLFGGGTHADLTRYGQGMASQELNNWWNRVAGVAGTGQSTANSLGNFGQNYANQVGQNAIGAGATRASSYAAQGNIWGDVANQGGNLLGQYLGSRNKGGGN